ncbi:FtsK/SpoIIIE family DNA translocase [Butyrivibrio sp. MC2013]|uniref:FtsK/SpoIIIE family DNA translocase n=1 Tax=Butyrivibrio sp. MC2013 TaxID=1280686 RepID=UPI000566B9BD|nr:DNA translocase FtsK [Butyrivibrio sp. MC2013]
MAKASSGSMKKNPPENRSNRSNKANGSRRSGSSKGAASARRDAAAVSGLAEYGLGTEIAVISLFALAIYLFLCNFRICGPIGNTLSDVMFGLFGFMAYIMPVFAASAAVFYISNRGSRPAVIKILAATGVVLDLGMLFEIIGGGTAESSYYLPAIYNSAVDLRGRGGVIAGSLAYALTHSVSMVGTVIIMLVLAIVCFVILSQKSFIRGMKKSGSSIRMKARDERLRYEEAAVRRRALHEERMRRIEEERRIARQQAEDDKILRRDIHVRGVNFNTDLRYDEDNEKGNEMGDVEEALASALESTIAVKEEENEHPPININSINDIRDDIHDDIHEISPRGFEKIPEGYSDGMGDPGDEEDEPYADSVDFDEITEDGPGGQRRFKGSSIEDEEHAADGRLVARMARSEEELSDELPQIPVHAGGKDYGNGISDEGYSIHAQDHVSASNSKVAIDGRRSEGGAMPTQSQTGGANDLSMALASQPVKKPAKPKPYVFPSTKLLKENKRNKNADSAAVLRETAIKLEKTLKTFGVNVTVTDISQGPTVTRYEIQPEVGVKVSKIVNLQDDIKLNLAATDIRIEAPIPGKAAIGIEVPNKENVTVSLRELLESQEFKQSTANLTFAVGKDIAGKTVITDIAKMPHVLIAGATGSGKSVCINTLVLSLIYKSSPEDVKLIMIDPKVVELSVYNGIPHLLIPVVTDPKKASAALNWAVAEMSRRYKLFADAEVRDLVGYNEYVEAHKSENENLARLPKIVIIVDELADLMMVAGNEVEEAICRLAQLARACGIHLVIATQRPSVDVITGLIKANMPSRIAFAVSSSTDSRTILDMVGAEKLLGKGDMLFYPQSMSKPVRLQGAFVSDGEIQQVTDFLKSRAGDDKYDEEVSRQVESMEAVSAASDASGKGSGSDKDEYFEDAGRFIIDKEKASIGMLQRVFKIGFNRAARIMDQLADCGVVSQEDGTKARKILMSMSEFEQMLKEG